MNHNYTKSLWNSQSTLRYLKQRGISDTTIKHFNLGLGDDKKSKLYNRLLFPITDITGNHLAYQGRALSEDQLPKYWHQPFDKKNVLYGLHENKHLIVKSDYVVLVEGNFDVLAWYEAGIPAIAPQGTALTIEQAVTLRIFTEHVVLAFDDDKAGKKSQEKAEEVLTECGFTVYGFAGYGDCKDANEFLMKHGKDELKELL